MRQENLKISNERLRNHNNVDQNNMKLPVRRKKKKGEHQKRT